MILSSRIVSIEASCLCSFAFASRDVKHAMTLAVSRHTLEQLPSFLSDIKRVSTVV